MTTDESTTLLVAPVPGGVVGESEGFLATLRRVDRWMGIAIVVACCGFVFWKLHPELLFRDTTTNGGDMGAHVWLPAYLREHVLSKWQVAGWSPDWFAGLAVGQFYFPLPSVLVVLLDVLLPYNVAFKIVTAIGPIMLPAAAFAFGRGIRAPRPAPVFFALGALGFLFYKGASAPTGAATTVTANQHIMGGNLASNLAGEYSYSLALVFALLFLGAFAVAMRDRRRLATAAALFAAVVLSHVVVAFFALAGALVIWLANRPVRRLRIAVPIGVVAALLTAVWVVPLLARFGYSTSLDYAKLTDYSAYLTPSSLTTVLVLAVFGVAAGLALLRPSTLILAVLAVSFNVWFRVWPVGHIWNLRFLPFWYLMVYLLAAVGLAEMVRVPRAVARWIVSGSFAAPDAASDAAPTGEMPASPADASGDVDADSDADAARRRRTEVVMAGVTTVLTLVVAVVGLVGFHRDNRKHHGFLDYWAHWNYSGYEAKPAYPEYRAVVDTMRSLPPGRALWEKVLENNVDTMNAYGGDYSLMLLPYWTHGRIGSMEGLYADGTATSPYHYLMDAHLAKNPAELVVIPASYGTTYATPLDRFAHGVRQMQAFGIRYYMAQSPEAKQLADTNLDLRLVAEVPDLDGAAPHGWKIYEVRDAPIVAPLTHEPVVVRDATGRAAWTRAADRWWESDDAALERPFAAAGPPSWRRVGAKQVPTATARSLPKNRVRNIVQTDDSISFDVSRPGVPVVVRSSYYPNWHVAGARGPYRLSPNLMTVVPTGHHVELHFRTTGADWLGLLLFAFGLVGLVGLAVWRPAEPAPRRRTAPEDVTGDATEELAEDRTGGTTDSPPDQQEQVPGTPAAIP
ncbi:MAG: 6-pyruvoyl-tetrahydropterin synthase-related protein [Acidimicrobiia bacterium]